MKKFALCFLTVLSISLTSCSGDDNETIEEPTVEEPTITYLYALDGDGNDVAGTILVKTENGNYVGNNGENSLVVENGKTYKFKAENWGQATINIHMVLDNGNNELNAIPDINGEHYFDVYPSGMTEIDLVVNF